MKDSKQVAQRRLLNEFIKVRGLTEEISPYSPVSEQKKGSYWVTKHEGGVLRLDYFPDDCPKGGFPSRRFAIIT